jgi:hypothetical protein
MFSVFTSSQSEQKVGTARVPSIITLGMTLSYHRALALNAVCNSCSSLGLFSFGLCSSVRVLARLLLLFQRPRHHADDNLGANKSMPVHVCEQRILPQSSSILALAEL